MPVIFLSIGALVWYLKRRKAGRKFGGEIHGNQSARNLQLTTDNVGQGFGKNNGEMGPEETVVFGTTERMVGWLQFTPVNPFADPVDWPRHRDSSEPEACLAIGPAQCLEPSPVTKASPYRAADMPPKLPNITPNSTTALCSPDTNRSALSFPSYVQRFYSSSTPPLVNEPFSGWSDTSSVTSSSVCDSCAELLGVYTEETEDLM